MSKLNQYKQYYTMSATNGGVRRFINVLPFENILWVHKNVSIFGAFPFRSLCEGGQSHKNHFFRQTRFFIAKAIVDVNDSTCNTIFVKVILSKGQWPN